MCAALSLSLNAIKPLNRWDYDSIRPGVVGSVGDCLITERLKSTFPGSFRWKQDYYGKNESLYGSSITNGTHVSYNSGGGPAKTIDSNWGGRRRFETSHGWVHEDLVPPATSVTTQLGSLPQYDWRNKIAEVNHARTTGDLFPRPNGPLVGGGVPRGGQVPRVTDVVSGDTSLQESRGFSLTDKGNYINASSSSNPNYKPHRSTNGGPASPEEEMNRRIQSGGRPSGNRMR